MDGLPHLIHPIILNFMQPTNETWEERFTDKFAFTQDGVLRMKTTVIDEQQYWKNATPKDLMKFISEERKRAQEEVISIIHEMVKDNVEYKYEDGTMENLKKDIEEYAQSLGLGIKE